MPIFAETSANAPARPPFPNAIVSAPAPLDSAENTGPATAPSFAIPSAAPTPPSTPTIPGHALLIQFPNGTRTLCHTSRTRNANPTSGESSSTPSAQFAGLKSPDRMTSTIPPIDPITAVIVSSAAPATACRPGVIRSIIGPTADVAWSIAPVIAVKNGPISGYTPDSSSAPNRPSAAPMFLKAPVVVLPPSSAAPDMDDIAARKSSVPISPAAPIL